MTWVKIDDMLNQNKKVRSLSLAARWTYIASICRAGNTLSDGEILAVDLSLVDGNSKIAKELEEAALWEPRSGGWYIHDYLVYNRSRAQTEETRRVNTENGRRGLANRYANRYANGIADGLAVSPSERPSESPSKRAISLLSSPTPQESPRRKKEKRDTTTSESPSEPLEAPKRTKPTKEWADEMREKYVLRDFDETMKFYMNQGYYRTCTDKCAYLEGKLKAASERERNGNGTRANAAHQGASGEDIAASWRAIGATVH